MIVDLNMTYKWILIKEWSLRVWIGFRWLKYMVWCALWWTSSWNFRFPQTAGNCLTGWWLWGRTIGWMDFLNWPPLLFDLSSQMIYYRINARCLFLFVLLGVLTWAKNTMGQSVSVCLSVWESFYCGVLNLREGVIASTGYPTFRTGSSYPARLGMALVQEWPETHQWR